MRKIEPDFQLLSRSTPPKFIKNTHISRFVVLLSTSTLTPTDTAAVGFLFSGNYQVENLSSSVLNGVRNSFQKGKASQKQKFKNYKMKKNNNEKKRELPKESAACVDQPQPSKKKNRKEVAIFGNYRNYYGYRVGQDLDEDPRLKMMKKEWFEGKDCLDIGCNSGLMTISLAKKFGCRSILGIDIDGARIEDAHWTLRKVVKTSTHRGTSKIQKPADVELTSSLEKSTESLNDEKGDDSGCSDLLKIVSFQKGNFVQGWRPPENTYYHAILCLSVTKWIHLNWGDDGLITLFWRVWKLLLPGGVFIVEPQPWSSYYNNRLVSETATTNYKNIQICPEDFQDILLDKIGFRRVENITSCISGTKAGFDRPVLAFWK